MRRLRYQHWNVKPKRRAISLAFDVSVQMDLETNPRVDVNHRFAFCGPWSFEQSDNRAVARHA